MNREAATADDAYTDHLLAIDEALAAGASVASAGADTPRAEFDHRVRRGLKALQALQQLRKSRGNDATPNLVDETAPGAGPVGSPPRRLGRFTIREELGRGGFGVVFRAHDPKLHRDVALKVPHTLTLVAPELRARFRREAHAAGSLDHPNIVPVFEVDEQGPIVVIAYAYCPGISLNEWLAARKDSVPIDDAARLIAQLADAVQHAHERGVVHRDLKPANILLVSRSQPATGSETGTGTDASDSCTDDAPDLGSTVPKITDFGLAKMEGADGAATKSGACLGTPAYMAPEQARGQAGMVGPAADLHALGVILYELLTGRPPFRGESDLDTLQQVVDREPIAPRQLRPKLPRDLETICLKCLEKDPARRYGSAADLRDDLRRFLAGEPILARPIGALARAGRWCRRKPMIAVLSAALLVAIGVGATATVREYRRANDERDRANGERNDAVAAQGRSVRMLAASQDAMQKLIDLAHRLAHDPATAHKSIDMLQVAHAYYRDLRAEHPDDPTLQFQAATVCKRLALILKDTGRLADAEPYWREALPIFEARVAEQPKDGLRRYDLHTTHLGLGYVLSQTNRPEQGEIHTEKARVLIEGLMADFPQAAAYVDGAAIMAYQRGELARQRKDYPAAEAEFDRAASLTARCLELQETQGGRIQYVQSLNRLADARLSQGRYADAEAPARLSVEQCRLTRQRFPKSPLDPYEAMALAVLRRILFETGRAAEAIPLGCKALQLLDRLVDQRVDGPSWYYHFMRTTLYTCESYDKLHREAETVPLLRKAVERQVPAFLPQTPSGEWLLCCSLLIERGKLGAEDQAWIAKARDAAKREDPNPRYVKSRERLLAALKKLDGGDAQP